MSLCKDIEKATSLDWNENNNNTLFVHSKDRAKQNGNPRLNVKPPKNAKLLESDSLLDANDMISEDAINETDIHIHISMANGGINYSNECLEEHWRSRQEQAGATSQSRKSQASTSKKGNDKSASASAKKSRSKANTSKNKKTLNSSDPMEIKDVLKKCKLNRNAAIEGLIRNDKIKLEDLKIPDDCSEEESLKEDKYRMKLVPHPEEPDVFVQPLQAYGDIDEEEYKEIDFTVPRLGRKKVVRPHEYYMYETDDTFFDFVQKEDSDQ